MGQNMRAVARPRSPRPQFIDASGPFVMSVGPSPKIEWAGSARAPQHGDSGAPEANDNGADEMMDPGGDECTHGQATTRTGEMEKAVSNSNHRKQRTYANVPAKASWTLLFSDWPLLIALAFGPVGGFVRLMPTVQSSSGGQ